MARLPIPSELRRKVPPGKAPRAAPQLPATSAGPRPGEGESAAAVPPAAAAAPALAFGSEPQFSADPGQLAQYANYVAALQLQMMAMGNMSVDAQSQLASQLMGGMGAGGAQQPPGETYHLAPARASDEHDAKRKFIGSVFKWDDHNGWGFISCLDARKVYGKDVFLHKAYYHYYNDYHCDHYY